MTDSSGEQKIYKMNLKCLVMPENEEVFKETNQWWYVKDTEANLKSSHGQRWKKLSHKINDVALGYNPEYKINVHEFILIKIND